jgi:hypothetical protein
MPLTGHAFDLEDLPRWTVGASAHVAKLDDAYYLVMPVALVGAAPEGIREFAREFVEQLNGAGRLLDPGFQAVQLGETLYGLNEAGQRAHVVLSISSGTLRLKGGHVTISVGGEAQPDHRVGAAVPLLEAARQSAAARDALVLVGRQQPTWSELYLAFELVEANTGRQMFAAGWISRSDERLFSQTANSYTALGRQARHGKTTRNPPSAPMSLTRATELVRQLVGAWLKREFPRRVGSAV